MHACMHVIDVIAEHVYMQTDACMWSGKTFWPGFVCMHACIFMTSDRSHIHMLAHVYMADGTKNLAGLYLMHACMHVIDVILACTYMVTHVYMHVHTCIRVHTCIHVYVGYNRQW